MARQGSFWRGIGLLKEPYLVTGEREFPTSFGQRMAGLIVCFFAMLGAVAAMVLLISAGALLLLENLFGQGDEQLFERYGWIVVAVLLFVALFCRLLGMVGMLIEGDSQPTRPHDLAFLGLKFLWSYFRSLGILAFAVLVVSLYVQSSFSASEPEVVAFVVSLVVSIALPFLAAKLREEE